MNEFESRVVQVIKENNLIESKRLDQALQNWGSRPEDDLENLFLTENLLNIDQVLWVKSQAYAVPLISIDPEAIDSELVKRFPKNLLYKGGVLPLFESDREITVAMVDPSRQDLIADLKRVCGCGIIPSIANPEHINYTLDCIFGLAEEEQESLEKISIDPAVLGHDDQDGVAVIFFNLMQAVRNDATEVLFEPGENGLDIFHRTDGKLTLAETVDSGRTEAILAKLEVMANLDPEEKLYSAKTLELELFSKGYLLTFILIRTSFNRKIKIKISPKAESSESLFPEIETSDFACMSKIINEESGIFLLNCKDSSFTNELLTRLAESLNQKKEIVFFGNKMDGVGSSPVVIDPDKISEPQTVFDPFLNTANPDIAIVDYIGFQKIKMPCNWILKGKLLILVLPFGSTEEGLAHLMAKEQNRAFLSVAFAGSVSIRTLCKLDPENSKKVEPTVLQKSVLSKSGVDISTIKFFVPGSGQFSQESISIYEFVEPGRELADIISGGADSLKLRRSIIAKNSKSVFSKALKLAELGEISFFDLLRF